MCVCVSVFCCSAPSDHASMLEGARAISMLYMEVCVYVCVCVSVFCCSAPSDHASVLEGARMSYQLMEPVCALT